MSRNASLAAIDGKCDYLGICLLGQFGRMIIDARNHPRTSIDHVMDVCLVRRCEIENLPLMKERSRYLQAKVSLIG